MNFKNIAVLFAAVSALVAQGAMAQTAAPAARADVKAATVDANKKGDKVPAGEGAAAPVTAPKK